MSNSGQCLIFMVETNKGSMMSKITCYEFTLPSFLVVPLEYGDLSGLEDEDVEVYNRLSETIDDIIRNENGTHYTIEYSDYSYFSYTPDFTKLGCDVVDAKVYIRKQ